ncbi:hypothetical protein BDV23DRAFT_5067 [Aspergillus alliaceus]|uniref:Uncharacterized protein n=1 Tax=Petromyces alliaceus TaxID=209559 RepID=A0A5N7CLZ0_PETAA|nr:hypothetical protein BDV23DRAFT_5067 [Aspergillus alliaceus]
MFKTRRFGPRTRLNAQVEGLKRADKDDYPISGFRFFSFATDANVILLLAKTRRESLACFPALLRKTVIRKTTTLESLPTTFIIIGEQAVS